MQFTDSSMVKRDTAQMLMLIASALIVVSEQSQRNMQGHISGGEAPPQPYAHACCMHGSDIAFVWCPRRSPTTGTAGYFINDELLRTSPNVYTLFVSATPYNLLTVDTQVPVENEHQWFTPNEATTYYGLQRYLEHGVAPGARGCQPGAIMKDLSLSDAARKMRLTPALEERWLTWREQAQTGEREKKSAQRTKLKMLMAVETRYAAAFLQAMGRRPADLPPGATLRLPDGSALPELPEGDLTLEMVQQLVQPDRRTGRGIMILVRVADQKCGRLLFGSMRRLRDFLGLQARVAVIIDINQTEARTDDNSFGLKETIEEPLLARLLRLQRASGLVPPDAAEPLLRQYSDLDGLPCVLILCEKGKMGDTFPRSLRYYDLRMRYVNSCTERAATEQDLGRAFRYISSPGAEAELPTILVSDQLHNWLMGKRGGRMGLLERPPSRPELMGKAPRTKVYDPPCPPFLAPTPGPPAISSLDAVITALGVRCSYVHAVIWTTLHRPT